MSTAHARRQGKVCGAKSSEEGRCQFRRGAAKNRRGGAAPRYVALDETLAMGWIESQLPVA